MSRIVIAILIAVAWLDGHAQSSLPPCPNDTSVTWTNCVGTYTFTDGAKYVGEFLDDKQHGQGTYTFASGDKYVGDFLNDKPHGRGTYTHTGGAKYVGEYRDGKPNGQGTYTYADGSKHVGEYRDGKRSGQGTLISADGYTVVEGIWESERQVSVGGVRWYRTSASDGLDYFVQPQSIRQEGAFRRAWLISAYNAPFTELKALSTRQLTKFDCAEERYQDLTTTVHSGSFGSGTIVHSLGETSWQYAPPGTVIQGVMKYVCDYKLTPIK